MALAEEGGGLGAKRSFRLLAAVGRAVHDSVMKIFAYAFLISVTASAAAKDGPVTTITKEELRTEAPRVIQEKLKEQIWNMFKREDYRRSERPRMPLTDLFIKTQTVETMVPGLCRYDEARIEFSPTHKGKPNTNTPSKATGLTARSYFKFLRPPAGDFNELADKTRSHDTPCSTTDDEGFFEAGDAKDATDGYLIWLNLQRALRDGRAIPLDCDLFENDTQPCTEIVKGVVPKDLQSIATCPAENFGERCFEVRTIDRSIKIYSNGFVSPGPPPNEVRRAKVGGMIVMWHKRID